MKRTRNKHHFFTEMKVVNELQELAKKEPTKENIETYKKMQDLFFKHVKSFAESK